MPVYCYQCGGALVATANPNINLCPVCGLAWFVTAQPYAPTVAQPSPEWSARVAEAAQEDYSHPGTFHAGRSWHGIFIHESCGFCGQQLQLTIDRISFTAHTVEDINHMFTSDLRRSFER